MRLLLDSHAALWWLANDGLGDGCQQMISEADEVFISPVTPWELGIKRARGKVDFPAGLLEELEATGFVELPITSRHAEMAAELPDLHRDPFDRMLVAQSKAEHLTLVTADGSLAVYGIDILDAAA
ncbi:MAG: type II toxin-antitoxin system VapC family toxin [Actinomycetota bacterium]